MTENISSIPTQKNYFPSDVLKWMKANAKPRMALKLMQICKYFQHEKFPFSHLQYVNWNPEDGLSFYVNKKHGKGILPNNLWFTGTLRFSYGYSLLFVLRKVIVCDIKYLHLSGQDITYDEFKFLSASGTIVECILYATPINYDNNEAIPFEVILGHLPNTKSIVISVDIPPWQSNDEKISFPKLIEITLFDVTENFNFEGFTNFMINNQKTNFYFVFVFLKSKTTVTYIQNVVKCIDKIVKEWKTENKPPGIEFRGCGEKPEEALTELKKLRKTYDQKMKEQEQKSER